MYILSPKSINNSSRHVWVVSYVTEITHTPIVTTFSNKKSAKKCYEAFVKDGKLNVEFDKCPLYKTFTILEEGK